MKSNIRECDSVFIKSQEHLDEWVEKMVQTYNACGLSGDHVKEYLEELCSEVEGGISFPCIIFHDAEFEEHVGGIVLASDFK